ncbi:MAG: PfkB family carbohydrate kinase [Nanoarchaeota archaeon]
MKKKYDVCGVGDIMVDVLATISKEELARLNLSQGVNELINLEKRDYLLNNLNALHQEFTVGGYLLTSFKAMSSLGLRTHLTAKVGMDEFGMAVQKELSKLRVETDFKLGFGCTDSRMVLIASGLMNRHTHKGISKNITFREIDSVKLKQAKNLLFYGDLLDTTNRIRLARFITRIAYESDTKIVFDLHSPTAMTSQKKEVLQIMERSSVVISSLDEAYFLFDKNDRLELLKELGSHAPVAILKTKENYLVNDHGKFLQVARMPMHSKYHDEYFAAGFIFGHTQDYGAERSAIIGSFLAGKPFIDDRILDELHEAFR